MRIRKAYVVAGFMAASVVAAGVGIAIRAYKRRRRRVIPMDVRKHMVELMKLQGEDFLPQRAPGGGLGKSVFMRYIERLDDRRLMELFAIVEVGYFLKASGINPLHPTKEQVRQAGEKFHVELAGAPRDRAVLLGQLDTTDAHDALVAAFQTLEAKLA